MRGIGGLVLAICVAATGACSTSTDLLGTQQPTEPAPTSQHPVATDGASTTAAESSAALTPTDSSTDSEADDSWVPISANVGECIDNETAPEEEVFDIPVVDCSLPHDSQVVGAFDLTGDEYSAELEKQAGNDCRAAFEDFVGTEFAKSSLLMSWYIPTMDSWAAGDREVICVIYLEDNSKVTGSWEGAGI